MDTLQIDFSHIRGMVFDVDGVLSANTIPLTAADGMPARTANIKDGYSLQLAVKRGMKIAIITGAKSQAVYNRYRSLGITSIFQAVSYKLPVLQAWMQQNGLLQNEVMYMGDDIPDYEVMKYCGLACCPRDAAEEIKEIAHYVSPIDGGLGCVRDVVSRILKAHGVWMTDKTAFGW